jgi:hypothetical protein
MSIQSWAQTLTIVNKSGSVVFLTVYGSSVKSCDHKYSSVPLQIDPSSQKVFKSFTELQWTGKKPAQSFEYSYLNGSVTDPSGGCVSNATNFVGSEKCNQKNTATIDLRKCNGMNGILHLRWTSAGNDVTVTIESVEFNGLNK